MSKQVVGKPPKIEYVHPYPIFSCPRCEGYVATAKLYRANYCSDCGQKINWGAFPKVGTSDDWCYDWRVMTSNRHDSELSKRAPF